MNLTKKEFHILIKDSTLNRLKDSYNKTYPNQEKSFSVFIENALIFYLTEKGAL